MTTFRIEGTVCDRSPHCPVKRVCPAGAVAPLPGGAYPGANGYTIDETRCAGCGVCVRSCPGGAVVIDN